MKTIIKVHDDIVTVPEAMSSLMKEYSDIGYQTEKITVINFNLIFPDGLVHIFWEKGRIYQEIFEN